MKHPSSQQQPDNERDMALRNLNAEENIFILLANKGNVAVIMKMEDDQNKIQDFQNLAMYKKIKHDLTTNILQKTNHLIKTSSILPDFHKSLGV